MDTQTVWVVDELGATFVFHDEKMAQTRYDDELRDGATRVSLTKAEAPAHLKGDELADWCASNVAVPYGETAPFSQIRSAFTCVTCMAEITVDGGGTWTDSAGAQQCDLPTGETHSPGRHFALSVVVDAELEPEEKVTPAQIALRGWNEVLRLEAPVVQIQQVDGNGVAEFDMEFLER